MSIQIEESSKVRSVVSLYSQPPSIPTLYDLVEKLINVTSPESRQLKVIGENGTPTFAVSTIPFKHEKRTTLDISNLIDRLTNLERINFEGVKNTVIGAGITISERSRQERILLKAIVRQLQITKGYELKRKRPEFKDRILIQGTPFEEILVRNKISIQESNSPSTPNSVEKRIDELFPITLADKKARLYTVLNWITECYIPKALELAKEIRKYEAENKEAKRRRVYTRDIEKYIKFEDAANKIDSLVKELDPNLNFDISRFGFTGGKLSLNQLSYLSEAIAEEIAIPNGLDFNIDFSSYGIDHGKYHIGIVTNDPLDESSKLISPEGRTVHYIKVESLNGVRTPQVINSRFISEASSHENKLHKRYEFMAGRVRYYTREAILRTSPFIVTSHKDAPTDSHEVDRTKALIRSDLIALAEHRLGRLFNPRNQNDYSVFLRSHLSSRSIFASKIRDAKSEAKKKEIAKTVTELKLLLISIVESSNPLSVFFDSVVPAIDYDYRSELRQRKLDIPEALEAQVRKSLENRNIGNLNFNQIMIDLMTYHRISQKRVRETFEKYDIKEVDKLDVLPIVHCIRNFALFRPKPDPLYTEREVATGRLAAKLLSKKFDPLLISQEGKLDIRKWREDLKLKLNTMSEIDMLSPYQRQVKFNDELRRAAFEILDRHFLLESDKLSPQWREYTAGRKIFKPTVSLG